MTNGSTRVVQEGVVLEGEGVCDPPNVGPKSSHVCGQNLKAVGVCVALLDQRPGSVRGWGVVGGQGKTGRAALGGKGQAR